MCFQGVSTTSSNCLPIVQLLTFIKRIAVLVINACLAGVRLIYRRANAWYGLDIVIIASASQVLSIISASESHQQSNW